MLLIVGDSQLIIVLLETMLQADCNAKMQEGHNGVPSVQVWNVYSHTFLSSVDQFIQALTLVSWCPNPRKERNVFESSKGLNLGPSKSAVNALTTPPPVVIIMWWCKLLYKNMLCEHYEMKF